MLNGAGIGILGMTIAGILNPVTVYRNQFYGATTNLTGRNVSDFSGRMLEAYGATTNLTGRNVSDFSGRMLEAYGAGLSSIVTGNVEVPQMGFLQTGPGQITPVANPVTADVGLQLMKQPGRKSFYGAGECPPGHQLNVVTGECVPAKAAYGVGELYDPAKDLGLTQAYGAINIRDFGETEFIGG